VVEEHLPRTVERLWIELVSYLTAAGWLFQGPRLKLEERNGQQSVSVRVMASADRMPLARYILNQSETHVLGLAWFFTRYLIHGQYRSASIVMDDPAQEMDQPTYRGFCRLVTKILRLHHLASRPWSFVVMLHQEDRALDLVRDTNGKLISLAWSKGQSDFGDIHSIRSMRLLGEGFAPPTAFALFGDKGTKHQSQETV
jgi:hypothetical protein